MNFKTNDIEALLNMTTEGKEGVYDQLHWSINTGADSTDIMSRVISVHEFMHNELNNVTAYGFLLQSYAYLSREKTELQTHYSEVLRQLVELSRTAHEAYATWQGIAIFTTADRENLDSELLKDNPEYEYYHACLQNLVASIPSLYLKRQVVSGIIYCCFQSTSIAKAASEDLQKFNPTLIRSSEFPTRRLEYITENFTGDYWLKAVANFVETQKQNVEYDLLQLAFTGQADEKLLLTADKDSLGEKLVEYIYHIASADFEKRNSFSMPYKSHMPYFKNLLSTLNDIVPFNTSKNPLIINEKPDDITRGVLQNFENEILQMAPEPFQCVVLLPEELDHENKHRILAGTSVHRHIFVVGCNKLLTKEQYIFANNETEEWFDRSPEVFTAIRFSGLIEGKRFVYFVPFNSPLDLLEFLKEKPVSVEILGAVMASACYNNDWWELWGAFFEKSCNEMCVMLDISPLHYIENVFTKDNDIHYFKMDLRMPETIRTCMLFHVLHKGETVALVAAPCSDIYAQALHHYMETRYSHFTNKQSLSVEQGRNVPIIITHVLREQYQYYYLSKHSFI